MLTDVGNGQAKDGTGMEGKLAEVLGQQRHQTGIMRSWGNFTEPDNVALHEKFDAEDAPAAEGGSD